MVYKSAMIAIITKGTTQYQTNQAPNKAAKVFMDPRGQPVRIVAGWFSVFSRTPRRRDNHACREVHQEPSSPPESHLRRFLGPEARRWVMRAQCSTIHNSERSQCNCPCQQG